jgi:hypothetical protein
VDLLRAEGFDVHEADITRLSPFVRHHVNPIWTSCRTVMGLDQRFPEPTRFWRLLAVIGPLPAGGNEELPGDGLIGHGLLLNAGLRRP